MRDTAGHLLSERLLQGRVLFRGEALVIWPFNLCGGVIVSSRDGPWSEPGALMGGGADAGLELCN
jgi:hypothetical protein